MFRYHGMEFSWENDIDGDDNDEDDSSFKIEEYGNILVNTSSKLVITSNIFRERSIIVSITFVINLI